jgi:uncharacterized protein (DUF1684 family)
LLTAGTSGRTTLAVFGPPRQPPRPTYYPVEHGLIVTAHLEPPERRGAFAVLGLDGMETSAVEAGVFRGQLAGTEFRLRVYLLQDSGSEESSLYVFFQDPTNDRGSYPGGRFVELLPEKDGAYRLDFNRARNPFCAYKTVFPCPAPWPGNRLTLPVPAGERYIKPSRGS